MDDDAAFLELCRSAVERRLVELTPGEAGRPSRLVEATRYALLSPGKRFRPMLTLLAAREFGAEMSLALDAACAFEMVHAASLILDDLPCMDDAQTRRGRPTTHREFGDANAILAAVGLLNQAYRVLSADAGLGEAVKADLCGRLSDAVGFDGLVAGQAMDLQDRQRARTLADLDLLNHRKTGVLIAAAAEAGALIAGAPPEAVGHVGAFARHLGLAFQIHDDLLDVLPAAELDKDSGKDAGMTTVPSLMGVEAAREALEEHLRAAERALVSAGARRRVLAPYVLGLFEARKAAA